MIIFSFLLISLILNVFAGCNGSYNNISSEDTTQKTIPEKYFILNIPEPSGLAFSPNQDELYTVSDRNGAVYRISITGEILEKLPFRGDDLEGIDVDRTNGDIWLVEERKQNIIHLDHAGNLIKKISDVHVKTKGNAGFEGIAIHGEMLYLLVEKDPGLLITYNHGSGEVSKYPLSFAKDYSGIDYDTSDNTLWIVSHESHTLNHCRTDGSLIKSQKIDVRQAEGVVVDQAAGIAWIIDDAGHSLNMIRINK